MIDGNQILKKAKCCVCEVDMIDSAHCNVMELPYVATWDYPRMRNLFSPDKTYHAVACICDNCIQAGKALTGIRWALQFTKDGEIIYLDIQKLEPADLGPNLN